MDGRPCDAATLVDLLARLHPTILELDEQARQEGDPQGPTYFEITTAAALVHFRNQRVDAAVLEVGLGGRLDSTNICQPIVTAITSISFDHTRQLGTTLAAIAGEKAGIIKPGVPLVTGVTQPEPFRVIEQTARDHDAPLLALGRDFDFDYVPNLPAADIGPDPAADWLCGLDYREEVRGVRRQFDRVAIGLLGRHQAANASVAIATCGELNRQGWRLDENGRAIRLGSSPLSGRIEILAKSPTVILDTAHNPASIAALIASITERFGTGPRLLMFATSLDKDATAMLEQLLPHFEHVVLTRYLNNPRATDPVKLQVSAEAIQQSRHLSQLTLHVRPDPGSAWRLIESLMSPAHLVCITGSFFLAGEARQHVEASQRVTLKSS